MTITGYGFDGTMAETPWAQLHELISDQVVSGMAPSVATGTRLVSVASGSAVGAGVMLKSDAATTVALDANSGSNPRIDWIVAQVDWTGTGGTGTITFVKGTPAASPVPPTLTQTPGTIWHIPLAKVTVRPGVGQIANGDLEDVRPRRQVPKVYADAIAGRTVSGSASDVVLSTITVPDPGWPYRLQVSAYVSYANTGAGHMVINPSINGSNLGKGATGDGNVSPAVAPGACTDSLTGASTVQLLTTAVGVSGQQNLNDGRLNVLLLPA